MSDRVPGSVSFVASAEQIKLAAAEGDGDKKLRKFSGIAYTGTKVSVGGWPYPVVTDLSGVTVSKKPRPILRDHDPGKVIGHTESVSISPRQISVDGVISAANDFAGEVIGSSDNGFPWQMSIGASVQKVVFVEDGEVATVNGRKVSGPVYIVRQAVLNEISFVALGADDHTSAKVAASASTPSVGVISMTFDAWLKEKGFEDGTSLTQKALDSLKAQFDLEQKAPEPRKPAPVSTGDLDDVLAKARLEQNRKQRITQIATEQISERPGEIERIEAMARLAMDSNQSPDQFELELLRAMRPQTGGIVGRRRDSQLPSKVFEAAICQSAGLATVEKEFDEQTLDMAHKHFRRGIGLAELVLMAARENGCTSLSLASNLAEVLKYAFPSDLRQSGGFSTISLPGILANTANKFLNEAFMAVESTWRNITAIRSVRDFKQVSSYSLTGDLTYEKVGAGGELEHGTLTETSYTNQADTYGKMMAVTRKDLINDDLGAFATVLRRLGRGGALKINNVFWTEFLDNSTFFTAGRNNFDDGASDTPFTADNLIRADSMFRSQTDPDGNPVAAMPRILLVPPALRIPALRLMNSQQVMKDTDLGSSNPWAGQFRVESSVYMANSSYTGYSALAWYLLADPSDIPVIETAFLNGREVPVVESAEADFNTLGIQMRAYHDFGVNLQEYRGGVKFKGEA